LETPRGAPVIAIGRTVAGCYHAVLVHDGVFDPDPDACGFADKAKHELAIVPLFGRG
jgi:hypothetical protein